MKILITGSSGLIGSEVCSYFGNQGHAIHGLHGLFILEIHAAYRWDAYSHIRPEKMGYLQLFG